MKKRIRPKRILAIKNRAIGDTVLLTGPLRLLRQHKPEYEIHVLVRSPAGELLEGLPYVDRVISVFEPKDKIERFAHWMRLIRRLRRYKYDLILNFHASFRAALTAKFLRGQTCVANHHELRGRNWFSDIVVPGKGQVKAVIDRDLDVLRAIGIQASLEEAMPEIVLSAAERREVVGFFAGDSKNGEGPRVFLGIGGSRATKRWPASHYIKLMRRMVRDFDARFVLSTVESDRAWLEVFWEALGDDPAMRARIRHFDGAPLRKTAQIISQCDAYIGNDSGLKHAAIALGLRSFTFFGPEAPHEWHPYDQKRHPYAFVNDLACRTEGGDHWCSIAICDRHSHQCMQMLEVERVWPDIDRILRNAD